MQDKLSAEEVAILIRARHLLKEKGLEPDADIKKVCEHAGVSRKTGYQWENQFFDSAKQKEEDALRKENKELKASVAMIEKELKDVRRENKGHKIAWEIHEVDKYIADKKNTIHRSKRKKR